MAEKDEVDVISLSHQTETLSYKEVKPSNTGAARNRVCVCFTEDRSASKWIVQLLSVCVSLKIGQLP